MRRFRPTYSNVVATLALFIALGGVSYAAFQLPANSVGRTHIRADAVGASELRNGAIGTKDLSRRLSNQLGAGVAASGPTSLGVNPPRSNNACAKYYPTNPSCVDKQFTTKSISGWGTAHWDEGCPTGYKSPARTVLALPTWVVDTAAGSYTGSGVFSPSNATDVLLSVTNWTVNRHDFTPHLACLPS